MKQKPWSTMLAYRPGRDLKKINQELLVLANICAVLQCLESSSLLIAVHQILTKTQGVWYECPRFTGG